MKELFKKFESLKSSSFIGIENYENSHGEVSNVNVLVNFDVNKAKQKDLETLKSLNEEDLEDIADSYNLDLETVKDALSDMIKRAEKNLSENKEDRTKQSQAQTDNYYHLTNAIKMHKDSMDVLVYGQKVNKTVLVEGNYPETNSKKKTIAKNAIKKHCDLRMPKYKQYKVGKMENLNVTGDTIQILKNRG